MKNDRMVRFRERAARLKRDLARELERLKIEEPEEYQKLVDAERTMWESFVEHQKSY